MFLMMPSLDRSPKYEIQEGEHCPEVAFEIRICCKGFGAKTYLGNYRLLFFKIFYPSDPENRQAFLEWVPRLGFQAEAA